MKLLSMRNHWKATRLFVLFLFSLLYSCEELNKLEEIFHRPPKYTQESADVVYDWYKLMAQIQMRVTPQPVVLLQNRGFAYTGVGLYEAVRPGIKGAVSLSTKLYQMPAMPKPENYQEYLWAASANAALASLFKQFLVNLTIADKARMDSLENANNSRFRLSKSDAVITRSQAFGRAIASAIYNWSTTDKFNLSSEGYTIPKFPGAWEPTPPAFATVGPFLKDSRPFLEYSITATAPPIPVPYSEDKSSQFYKEAKEVYDIGKALTDEQKATANWFADAGGVGVGVPAPYHATNLVTEILESKKAKLGQAAQVYAKTGIALKDGPIVTFRGKFQYNLIRPLTYIQKQIDKTWQSYLINPPYPEYPSGLAGIYCPFWQVMIREFGDIPVTDNTYVWRGDAPRQYASISKLLDEALESRIYGGLHYRFTMEATREMGNKLGDKIANINLTPKH